MATDNSVMTVYFVDDDEDDRLLLQEAWSEFAPDDLMQMADDGSSLLDKLKIHLNEGSLPDLVLLDLNMPRMNGHEVLLALKGDDRFSQIPIIVITTSSSPEDISLSYSNGASAFITKSSEFTEMVNNLRRVRDFWAWQPRDVTPAKDLPERAKRVFICDDNDATRKIYRHYFERRAPDWIVQSFRSGEDLLDAFDHEPCDVVISDIKMPRMDGITLTRELAARRPDISIFLITATDSKVDPALHPNLRGILRKPVDPALLIEMLQNET